MFSLILTCLLTASFSPKVGSTPTEADLAALFRAAHQDAANVVPLIREASRVFPTLDAAAAVKLGDSLEPFAERAFFGAERLAGMEALGLVLHQVESGENPTRITSKRGTGPKMLELLNEHFDARRLQVGQKLKALEIGAGELVIEVSKSRFRLALWRTLPGGGRALMMHVPVGLGAAGSPTPTGTTTITKRVLDPQWTDPTTKQVFAPKDPGNVLGGYWIALAAEGLGGRSGIGLHGFTGAPAADWIQQGASHGCVRMLQHDIDRVFHAAIEGTRVVIVE